MDTLLTRSMFFLKDTAILLEASVDSRTAESPSQTLPRARPADTGECWIAKALIEFFKPGSQAAVQAGGARVQVQVQVPHPVLGFSKPPRSIDEDQAEREPDQNTSTFAESRMKGWQMES